jgi:hypothetical protein
MPGAEQGVAAAHAARDTGEGAGFVTADREGPVQLQAEHIAVEGQRGVQIADIDDDVVYLADARLAGDAIRPVVLTHPD